MHEEELFRAIAAIAFVLDLGISGLYRRGARNAARRPDRREESLGLRAGRVLVAGPLFLGFLVLLLRPSWLAWAGVDLPAAVRWGGALLAMATVPLTWWLMRHLGSNVTETVLTREEARLVTSGPYRRVRHPLYTTSLLLWVGVSVATANLFLTTFTCLYGWFLLDLVIPREERALLMAFGTEYVRYRERTGRLLPRIG